MQKVFSLTAAMLLVALNSGSTTPCLARGFGGGGRGGGYAMGGRGDGGDFDRGYYNRGGEGFGDAGRINDGVDSLSEGSRLDAFNASSHVSEAQLRAGANHDYGSGEQAMRNSFASDGGFDRVANSSYAEGYRPATYRMTPAQLTGYGDSVRGAFSDRNLYDRDWWNEHANAWRDPYYFGDGWAWGATGWPELAGFWGMSAGSDLPELPEYEYGNNVTYENNEVYYGSQPSCTASQYYTQARDLALAANSMPAESGPVQSSEAESVAAITSSTGNGPDPRSWKALGVFSLVQGAQSNSVSVFQLAVNKQGFINGNYVNELTGEVEPVQGAVDKKTMRAAWTVGKNKTVVYDSGLSNLLQRQSTCLVHFNKNHTEQWSLVRLAAPKATAKSG